MVYDSPDLESTSKSSFWKGLLWESLKAVHITYSGFSEIGQNLSQLTKSSKKPEWETTSNYNCLTEDIEPQIGTDHQFSTATFKSNIA